MAKLLSEPSLSLYIVVIGTYFNCIMFMVASSVVTTIMILNYHHRKAHTHNMPDWVGCSLLPSVFADCFLLRSG